jgi:hypothetical protein
MFSTFLLRACFLNIQIKVRIYNPVGGDPILYYIEVTLQNEIFYPPNQSASQILTHHSTSHNVSAKLNTTPTVLRHDTRRTGSEVCIRVPSNSISSFNPIQLPRILSNSDNSRSNHKASQNAGSLVTRWCCFVPMITSYWLHTWQSQYFHLRDAHTSFGYSTCKLKSSPSPDTFLRATNSFGRPDTRVIVFCAKYVLTNLTHPRSRPSRHWIYFKLCGMKLCSCLTENTLHCY